MDDERKYMIEIYHNGVCMKAPIHGHQRYLEEKAFLQRITGWFAPPDSAVGSEPELDFFELDDQQFVEYGQFRKGLRKDSSQS